MMECLTNIIGVTLSDCQCIIQGLNTEEVANLRLSTSKLYMDDLEGGVHLKALTRVDACRSMYQMAIAARDNAIQTMADDLVVALNSRYTVDRKTFVGNIGRMSFATSLATSRNIQGIEVRPTHYGDGVLKINKMYLAVNGSVTTTVKIYRAFRDTVMGEEVFSFPVDAVANAFTVVPITNAPIYLPLAYQGEIVDYFIVYDTNVAGGPVLPKDTTIQCSTCHKGISPFGDYVTAHGIQLNSVSALNDKMTDLYSHGIILDAEIRCSNEKLFCREYKENEAIAVVMAYAARYKAGELLIEDLMKQTDITRYTTMGREYLWGKRSHFQKLYQTRIDYLSTSIDVTDSNCYVCREQPNQPFFGKILS